jgi:hypothetical protein
MGNVGTPPPNPNADPTPAPTAREAAAIAGAGVGFRGTYGGAGGRAYEDYVAMYNQQQAQVQAQQTYISAQENSRIQQDRQQAQSKYTQSTIRDTRGNVVGYQPVDAQNPYYANLTTEKTQKYANYNQKINQYEFQHGAIVGSSPTLYPVKTNEGKTVYAGVAGASFQQFQPTAQRDGEVVITGRAADRAASYSEPQRSVYWKPESQVQKDYARDVLLKQGQQLSVINPMLDKQYGADYENKYATYYEGIRGRERAQATITNQPSSFSHIE